MLWTLLLNIEDSYWITSHARANQALNSLAVTRRELQPVRLTLSLGASTAVMQCDTVEREPPSATSALGPGSFSVLGHRRLVYADGGVDQHLDAVPAPGP